MHGIQRQHLEGELHHAPGCFGCITPSPVIRQHAPGDFGQRRMGNVTVLLHRMQTRHADEFPRGLQRHRPDAPAMRHQKCLKPAHLRTAFRGRQYTRKITHDARIGIQPCVRQKIGIRPRPQGQARRIQYRYLPACRLLVTPTGMPIIPTDMLVIPIGMLATPTSMPVPPTGMFVAPPGTFVSPPVCRAAHGFSSRSRRPSSLSVMM